MTLIASASRGLAYLTLALIGLPLMLYGTGQTQMTGLAGVATGLSLLTLHLFGFAFTGARTAKPPARSRHRTAYRVQGDMTWDRVTQARRERLAELRRQGKKYHFSS